MIKNFTCHNFRNVDVANLEFSKINVFIGPNNSGKTNFIRALTFFSSALRGISDTETNGMTSFLNAINKNGWEHLRNKDVSNDCSVEFDWKIQIAATDWFRYNLAFRVGNSPEYCNISSESLDSADPEYHYRNPFNFFICHREQIGKGMFSTAMQKGRQNKRLKVDVDPKELVVRQMKDILLNNPPLYNNEGIRTSISNRIQQIEDYFKAFGIYSSARFNTEKIRVPANPREIGDVLRSDASNFVNVFNRYTAEDLNWKISYKNKMKELIHGLADINVSLAYEKLIFTLSCNEHSFDLSDVSVGTLKGLILNLLLHAPASKAPALLALDEIESNLHPAWQKVVAQWILLDGIFQQCFISTHSPDFLDAFTDQFCDGRVAVFVFGLNGKIRQLVPKDVSKEIEEGWQLGDLYRVNEPSVGGWPW